MTLLLLFGNGPLVQTGTFTANGRLLVQPHPIFKGAGVRVTAAFDVTVTAPVTVVLRPPGGATDGSQDIHLDASPVTASTDDCVAEFLADGMDVYDLVFTGSLNGAWEMRVVTADPPPAVVEGRALVKASVFV